VRRVALRIYSGDREWLLDIDPNAYDAVLHLDDRYDNSLYHSKPLPEGAKPLRVIRVHGRVAGRRRQLYPYLDFRIFAIKDLSAIKVFRVLFVHKAIENLLGKFEDTEVEVTEELLPALVNYDEFVNFDVEKEWRRPIIERYLNAVEPLVKVRRVPGRALPEDLKEKMKVLWEVKEAKGLGAMLRLFRSPGPWGALKSLGVLVDINGALHVLAQRLPDGGWAAVGGMRVIADRVPEPAVAPLPGGQCLLYGVAKIREVVFKVSEDGYTVGGFARADFVAVYPQCTRTIRVRAHRVRRE
jgi:hypothetical protein